MRVNCVVKPGWILERCARELEARVPGITVNAGRADRATTPDVDLTYYLPAQDVRKYPAPGRAVGFVTHGAAAFPYLSQFAAVVTMNQARAASARAEGARRVVTVRPGIDLSLWRMPIFGVVGRIYNSGRKGEHLVEAAVQEGVRVVACGASTHVRAMSRRQWPCELTHTWEDRAAFYETIDYLLVTSLEEGGPMPVPEAIAAGVPVIAPDVGWCWEFPVIRYACGSWPSLRAVLQGLTSPPTWAAWAEGHRVLFEEVIHG